MVLTADQEIWGVALWVERTQGVNGGEWIGKTIARFEEADDQGGVALWSKVAERHSELTGHKLPPN